MIQGFVIVFVLFCFLFFVLEGLFFVFCFMLFLGFVSWFVWVFFFFVFLFCFVCFFALFFVTVRFQQQHKKENFRKPSQLIDTKKPYRFHFCVMRKYCEGWALRTKITTFTFYAIKWLAKNDNFYTLVVLIALLFIHSSVFPIIYL